MRSCICIVEMSGMSKQEGGEIGEEQEIEEEQEEELSNDKLNEDELKNLVKKATSSGVHESMFILTLSEWHRPGGSFSDYGRFQVLYGEIETTELDHVYDYPTTNETVYAIIPKSKTVVIIFESGDDYQGKMQRHQKLYIFTYSTGWKSLDIS